MRQRAMVENENGKFRGWFDEKEVPVRITPWKNAQWKRARRCGVRPLKKLTPAIELLLKGKPATTIDLAA